MNIKPNLLAVFTIFLKLGLTSFGGPVAHVAYFRKKFVEELQWLTEEEFGQLLAICQFLPGPASSQLGFSLGLLRAGWGGAILAFLGFTLPSIVLLIGFALALPNFSDNISNTVIHGLKLVACIVVTDAVINMYKKICFDKKRQTIALLSMAVLVIVGSAIGQIVVVLGGALLGIYLCKDAQPNSSNAIRLRYSTKTGVLLLSLFFVVLLLFGLLQGQGDIFAIGNAFYRAGSLVFGGGHVVLPLLEESIVQPQWISEETFLAGYGASQAIPGPMFSFSAYLGTVIPSSYHFLITATVAVVFMFLPGFLLISAILPLWNNFSKISMAPRILAGVNASIVGLLGAALYNPIYSSSIVSPTDIAVVILGFIALHVWKISSLFIVMGTVFTSLLIVFINS